jgi:hypothetical protein
MTIMQKAALSVSMIVLSNNKLETVASDKETYSHCLQVNNYKDAKEHNAVESSTLIIVTNLQDWKPTQQENWLHELFSELTTHFHVIPATISPLTYASALTLVTLLNSRETDRNVQCTNV